MIWSAYMPKYEDENFYRTQQLGLDKTVARCAVVVQEKHPRTGEDHVVVSTVIRPYWSKQGAGEKSLVGGKVNDTDIKNAEIPPNVRDLNMGQSIEIERRTAQREVEQEIGVQVPLEQLIYVGLYYNGPWASALFYVLLDQRPPVTIGQADSPMDEIDGFVWLGTEKVGDDGTIFADHRVLIAEAVKEARGAQGGKK